MSLDPTYLLISLGAVLIGALSGGLGSYALLRRESLLGDAVSHAALPGVVLGYLVAGRAPLFLLLGAGLTGWLAALAALGVSRNTRVKFDGALAIVLSAGFGLGVVLLGWIQNNPAAAQAGLNTFLFGQAALILREDLVVIAVAGSVFVTLILLFWKELALAAFDPAYAATAGYPVRMLDAGFMAILVLAIVVGLQAVGVVLMSALVVAPAAAARQWVHTLAAMMPLAAGLGAVAGLLGALWSTASGVPTGPAIVMVLGVIVLISLLLAPERGVLRRAR